MRAGAGDAAQSHCERARGGGRRRGPSVSVPASSSSPSRTLFIRRPAFRRYFRSGPRSINPPGRPVRAYYADPPMAAGSRGRRFRVVSSRRARDRTPCLKALPRAGGGSGAGLAFFVLRNGFFVLPYPVALHAEILCDCTVL